MCCSPDWVPGACGRFDSSGEPANSLSTALSARESGCSSIIITRAGKVSASGLLLGVSFSQFGVGVWGSSEVGGEGWLFALFFPAAGVLLLGLL